MVENSTDVIITYFPPVPEISERALLVVGSLLISFVVSIAGHTSNLAWQSYCQRMHKQNNTFTPNPLLLNIKLISITQICVAFTLPAVIVDYLLEFWLFGSFVCSCHFVLLNFSRTATIWILVNSILDETLQEKSLRISETRRRIIHLVMHGAILFFGALLLFPTLLHIQLVEETLKDENVELRIQRCLMSFDNNSNNKILINSATFLVDFALPFLVCTSLTIYTRHFRQQGHQLMGAQSNRIQNLLLAVCAIFFLFNVPHFLAIFLILFGNVLNFNLHNDGASAIADTALLCTYAIPALLWILINLIQNTVFENMNFGSQHCLTLNSTAASRARVFSNQSYTSECHSLPGNLSRSCTREQLKPSSSLNPLDTNGSVVKSARNPTTMKRPNFREIKSKTRERLLRLEHQQADEQL
ncbi:hypothetical protein M3Y97_00779100 [Aphelenchoides bicaudatus]|nr:hypothetical protein M3Y97_00779100 [Aphelenchoides bicaudatus]